MKEFSSKKTAENAITFCFALALFAFIVELLALSEVVSQEVVRSIKICLTTIIPSLFGFMVISDILISSNLYRVLSIPFYPLSKYILRINPNLFSVFIISNLAGYPIGSKMLSSMVKNNQITKEDASDMACYCFASGPAFIIGIVGVGIFYNAYVGLLIFISIFLSNLILASLIGLKRKVPQKTYQYNKVRFSSNNFVESVEKSSKSLLIICAMIIFFSTTITILSQIGTFDFIVNRLNLTENELPLIKSLVEISNIGSLKKYSYKLIPYIAAALSFGGVCVLMQTIAMSGNSFSLKKFYFTRPIHAILSAVISNLLISRYAKHIALMTIVRPVEIYESKSLIPSLLLIIMIIILLSKKSVAIRRKV